MRLASPLALAALISAVVLSGDAVAGEVPPLTCSFIYDMCLTECGKEQGPLICQHYCTGRKNSCMFTGRWTGRFDDRFESVIKK